MHNISITELAEKALLKFVGKKENFRLKKEEELSPAVKSLIGIAKPSGTQKWRNEQGKWGIIWKINETSKRKGEICAIFSCLFFFVWQILFIKSEVDIFFNLINHIDVNFTRNDVDIDIITTSVNIDGGINNR